MKRFLTVFLTFVLSVTAVFSASNTASAYTVSDNMQWWADAKFGMFIHFGAYSAYGQGEWAMSEQNISKQDYQTQIAANFNPVNFDAEQIVNYAKKAGMKYIVITAKHHEGFSMWDTQVESFTDYTGTTMFSLQAYTPFGETGRDILMELKDACDAAGLKFGLYYSIIDWNHSSQTIGGGYSVMQSMEARQDYITDMKAQLKELVEIYDPDLLWFDGSWTKNTGEPTLEKWWTKSDGEDLYAYMKQLNPDIIVNERVFSDAGLGDYACPENSMPAQALDRSWELCETMNGAWGYKQSREDSYYSAKKFVRDLTEAASKGGNLLLNIGPKGDGSMTAGSKKILNRVGKWMNTYGESVYGTTKSPFKKVPKWGVYTRDKKTIYAHVYKWPSNKTLTAKRYKKGTLKLKRVYLVGTDKDLTYTVKKGKVIVDVPKNAKDKKDTVIAFEYAKK